jgi:hypothetical protein
VTDVITFRRVSLYERLSMLIPSVRRAKHARMEAAIAALVHNPELPCVVEGYFIPNGYGSAVAVTQ